MDKKFYFMAGLPRAGSTLLSTLLNQNPRFHSGPSSPVLGAMFALHDNFQGNELYTGYPKPVRVNEIVGSVIRHWYSCLLYTSPSPRDRQKSRMPSSA